MKYAQVVVNTPLVVATPRQEEPAPAESSRTRAFTYSVPAALADAIALGQLVWVPFGARRLQGLVVAFVDSSPVAETKDIEAIVDPHPFLTAAQIDLAHWMSDTYLCSLNDALQLMLPPGVEQQTETLLSLDDAAPRTGLTLKQNVLLDLLTREGSVRASQLPRELRSAVEPLARRGLVRKQSYLPPPRAKPKHVKSVRLRAGEEEVQAALNRLGKPNPPADALAHLARTPGAHLSVKEVCRAVPCSSAALASLARRGFVELVPAQESMELTAKYYDELPALAAAQSRALVYLREHAGHATVAELKQAVRVNANVLRALEDKGYVERKCTEPQVVLRLTPDESLRAARQLHGRQVYREIVDLLKQEQGPVWVSGLYAATDCTLRDLQKLQAAGIISLEEEETWRDSLAGRSFAPAAPPRLTAEQQAALEEIVSSLEFQVPSLETASGSVDAQKATLQQEAPKGGPETWNMEPGTSNLQPETPRGGPEAWNLKPGTHSSVFLLHGVTGSGKTEIYLAALAEALQRGQRGIVLVPEISLTPQTIRRFGARFPNRIAVLHSRLGLGERYDTWRRCRAGMVDVVIGSRSALFAPLPQLGLIVIDEEHEPAYKQEATPHYHAREVAIELARRVGATVVLGSATPDLASCYRAARGEFRLLELPQRIMGHQPKAAASPALPPVSTSGTIGAEGAAASDKSAEGETCAGGERPAGCAAPGAESAVAPADAEPLTVALPPVQVVDLRAELKAGNRSIFSRVLQQEMARVLAAREQVILFLNRRGAASFILCRDCGYVCKCRRCDNPLTFHLSDAGAAGGGLGEQLVCHHCNRRERVPVKCPSCRSTRIRYFGIGTQRVEQEIRTLFPQARPLRWDFDVTHGKESHEAILETFIQHRADVLIGTQMIAKGLDLPRVTLVGVVSADTSLNLPDFRSAERTFQLLTQVAGRAGRSILGGRVVVQTYHPDHYAIQAASHHDYRAFYEQELRFRREQGYPPFNRLIRLLYAHTNRRRAEEEATRWHHLLATRVAQRGLPALDLIGPAPAFFHRLRGEYRYQILVRGPDPHALLQDLSFPLGWRVDVDPVSVL